MEAKLPAKLTGSTEIIMFGMWALVKRLDRFSQSLEASVFHFNTLTNEWVNFK